MDKLAFSVQQLAVGDQRSVLGVLRLMFFSLRRVQRRRQIGWIELSDPFEHELNLRGEGESQWSYGANSYFWAGGSLYMAPRDIQLRSRFWIRHERILLTRLLLNLYLVCVPLVLSLIYAIVRFAIGGE